MLWHRSNIRLKKCHVRQAGCSRVSMCGLNHSGREIDAHDLTAGQNACKSGKLRPRSAAQIENPGAHGQQRLDYIQSLGDDRLSKIRYVGFVKCAEFIELWDLAIFRRRVFQQCWE